MAVKLPGIIIAICEMIFAFWRNLFSNRTKFITGKEKGAGECFLWENTAFMPHEKGPKLMFPAGLWEGICPYEFNR